MIHFGDITKINGAAVPIVDVITGGSPCQDLSVAGKRAGLDGERSGLFMEQIRIVKEMRNESIRRSDEFIRPRYMVWENVPGAFSSNGGADFQAVLTEIVRIAQPNASDVPLFGGGKRWAKAGVLMGIGTDGQPFSVAYRVHDAQFWGVPQRRKRIALVADFGGISAPEVLFERKGVSGDFEPGETARKETAADVGGGSASAICLQGNGIDMAETAGCNGRGWNEDDVCYTLNTIDRPAVCAGFKAGQSKNGGIGWEVEQAPTLSADCSGTEPTVFDARGNGNGKTAPTITGDHENRITGNTVCRQNAVVRRLTPMEAERLQGFPDHWSDIGEWIDTKGKRHKTNDSQRYRALGNSLALPFWAWLAKRICEQYDRPVEMASLFDGIGGFPLVFERAGAKAVWASEVEEFCIAVTKRRFPE